MQYIWWQSESIFVDKAFHFGRYIVENWNEEVAVWRNVTECDGQI